MSKKNGKWENRPRVDAEHAPEERLVAPTLWPSLTYLLDLAPGPLGRTYRPQLAIRFRAPDASVRAPLPCSSRAHARLVLEYENSNRVVIAIIDSMPRAIQRVVCAPKAWRRARASTRRDPLGRRHARSSSWSWHTWLGLGLGLGLGFGFGFGFGLRLRLGLGLGLVLGLGLELAHGHDRRGEAQQGGRQRVVQPRLGVRLGLGLGRGRG